MSRNRDWYVEPRLVRATQLRFKRVMPDSLFRGLDAGIRAYCRVLWENGINTHQSCQGGKGHSYTAPTVDFSGTVEEGWRALSVALAHGLPVRTLQRVWEVRESEPHGPFWRMTFEVS